MSHWLALLLLVAPVLIGLSVLLYLAESPVPRSSCLYCDAPFLSGRKGSFCGFCSPACEKDYRSVTALRDIYERRIHPSSYEQGLADIKLLRGVKPCV